MVFISLSTWRLSTKRFCIEQSAMHDSVIRLLECARAATANERHPVNDFPALIERLNVTSATMTNWKQRGVSKEGALAAESIFGCSAHFIRQGTRPELKTRQVVEEPSGRYHVAPDLLQTLMRLAELLRPADALTRHGVSPLLARLVLEPDEAASIASMITAMMDARSKRAG